MGDENFFDKCKVVNEWLVKNFAPWASQTKVAPAEAVGGLFLFAAITTIAASKIGEIADQNAIQVLRQSFKLVRRRMHESGIMEPGAPFGAPGRKP